MVRSKGDRAVSGGSGAKKSAKRGQTVQKGLKMSEKDVTRVVRDLLKARQVWHFKHWSGPLSRKGVSDILGIRTWTAGWIADRVASGEIKRDEKIGVFVALELKAEGKKPHNVVKGRRVMDERTTNQHEFIEEVRQAGGIGGLADCVEDVERLLKLACRGHVVRKKQCENE
jgi:hypothetical protein